MTTDRPYALLGGRGGAGGAAPVLGQPVRPQRGGGSPAVVQRRFQARPSGAELVVAR